MVFLTLTSVNKSVKFGLKAKHIFFFREIEKERYVSHIRFAFHSKSLQPKYKRPTNKSKRVLKFFFQNFLISKKTCLARYQNN
jgi:hypothetical protein